MNKKILALCVILAALLLSGIGYGFYKLFGASDLGIIVDDSRMSALYAIPSDAILVYDLDRLSDLTSPLLTESSNFSSFVGEDSPLFSFLELMPKSADGYTAAFSLHYSSRDEVSPLFVLALPKSLDKEAFSKAILKRCAGVIHKRYDGSTVYSSVLPRIAYSVYNNFLIASTSLVILESSLRHLQSSSSILENPIFKEMSSRVRGDAAIHVNHQNLGKLFSGVVNRPYLKYADFFRTFATWTTINLDSDDESCLGEGLIYNDDEFNFSAIFDSQESLEPDISNYIPFNTNYFLSIPLPDDKAFVSKYKAYLAAQKKYNDYTYLNAIATRGCGDTLSTSDWFFSMKPREIGMASVPFGNVSERIFMVRSRGLGSLRDYSKEINVFKYKGYISAFLGDVFKPSAEEAFCVVSDWVIIGSKRAVSAYYSAYNSGEFFSFSKYIAQTPLDFSVRDNASVLFMMNLSRSRGVFETIFKKSLSDNFVAGFSDHNFNFFSFRVINDGSRLNVESSIVIDNLTKLPVLNVRTEKGEKSKIIDDTPLTTPKGPFKIKDFVSGKANYMRQLSSNGLNLLDHDRKSIWTIPFSQPLCGYVGQIDYFKNDKLQMIFASGSKIHLLDRLGRWVKPFPLDLKKVIAIGPKIYDFRGARRYSMMVLHADNTVELYDIEGSREEGWNVITEDEKIKSMPELLDIGGKRYWVVRTFFQTKIYNRLGVVVADFSKKNRLRPDTEIKRLSSNEVGLTTATGQIMILNLETGAFRKSE